MKHNASPKAIERSDYRVPDFLLETVDLCFDLRKASTRVKSRLVLYKNPISHEDNTLRLDGEELKLFSVAVDGVILDPADYSLDEHCLIIPGVGDRCVVEIETECDPQHNTRLEGLYRSSGNYCTQCEAQGFRRISFFPDRPDVMAMYSVEIRADKLQYPVLLSNGNLVKQMDLEHGRHMVLWQDPHPKPSYLFALVAGDLACISDRYTTGSGREVDLRIYVQHHNSDKCAFAMESLKKSMAWDEQRFGLEYDLDIYMIVAVDDFNMGAMENKGLNIFNSKYVLADRNSATDVDFEGIESVIGHEYFHNWTGNRVTCRDWFQLSLKEGLTVFRDQQFSSDLNSRAVKRINDVRQLRARQFPEDAGPMAHPIRPDSYIEINNFYTSTVYEKGAEVIRMMHCLLGEKNFREGMDLYFERHDGQAVTCEDFVSAMEAASGVDLKQFRRWYAQAGTPTLKVTSHYDQTASEYSLTISQESKTQIYNKPFHIPFALGLLDRQGNPLSLQLRAGGQQADEIVLNITKPNETYTFANIKSKPVPSLLRRFSAPVYLEYEATDEELAFLMQFDTDSFNRWEASQRLATRVIEKELYGSEKPGTELNIHFAGAIDLLLDENLTDAALRAETLSLPALDAIIELQSEVDTDSVFQAREKIRRLIAENFQEKLLRLYRFCSASQSDDINPEAIAVRRLKNVVLNYITTLDSSLWKEMVLKQYTASGGMTDTLAALRELSHHDLDERISALDNFYRDWKDNRLVIDKWFAVQAMSLRENTLDEVKELTGHEDFDIANPNRVRALISTFSVANPVRFHAQDGQGYGFLADYVIRLDKLNPQLAARLASPLSRWKRFNRQRQALMLEQLQRIARTEALSADVYEIVKKSLDAAT